MELIRRFFQRLIGLADWFVAFLIDPIVRIVEAVFSYFERREETKIAEINWQIRSLDLEIAKLQRSTGLRAYAA